MKTSWNFARVGLGGGMNTCSRPSGYTRQPLASAAKQGHPFRLLFGREYRTQMGATSPSPDDECMDGLHNLIADKSENLRQVQKVRKDLQHRHEQGRLPREHRNAAETPPTRAPQRRNQTHLYRNPSETGRLGFW